MQFFASLTRPLSMGLSMLVFIASVSVSAVAQQEAERRQESPWESSDFRWTVSDPILALDADRLPPSPEHPWIAVKDPSIVRFEDRWHLFATLRKDKEGEGRIRIGYTSFGEWDQAQAAQWSVLELTNDYHGAPQIFFFEPEGLWYLVYQAADSTRELPYGPCYSTNPRLDDPAGWTKPQPLYQVPEGQNAGLDFWVICDSSRAYLFFTTLDGKMRRAETSLDDFPDQGWSEPVIALEADIFEASHTYWSTDRQEYVTIIEAQGNNRRYFKAYRATQLSGEWEPIADRIDKPFVGPSNVVNQDASWTTNYSHGEFLRTGIDQRLEIDTRELKLLFQGANDSEYRQSYGKIPWRLGLLHLAPPSP